MRRLISGVARLDRARVQGYQKPLPLFRSSPHRVRLGPHKYLKTYSTLTNCGKTVILCWIPSHVGIPGNERADRVAKAALSLPISPVKVSAMDYLPRAKLLMYKEWQEIWNCCDGNKLHAINPTVGVTKLNGSLSRKDAVIIKAIWLF